MNFPDVFVDLPAFLHRLTMVAKLSSSRIIGRCFLRDCVPVYAMACDAFLSAGASSPVAGPGHEMAAVPGAARS